jgi:hypothetical protein
MYRDAIGVTVIMFCSNDTRHGTDLRCRSILLAKHIIDQRPALPGKYKPAQGHSLNQKTPVANRCHSGGPRGTRTHNRLIKSQLLCQLS